MRYFRGGRGNCLIRLTQHSTTARLFTYFVNMIGTSGGEESATLSAENELNHLLTMFQKCCEAIKGFQFHFSRGIVCGEQSSKSSEPHHITKISKNVRSRDQFKKYETETRSL